MKQGTSAKGYCPCGPSKRSKSPAPAHLLPVALLNQRTHGCSLNQSLIHFQRLHTHGDRQMDTQTHKHRHTNTHKHTHTHRHTDTHTHTHTDRHTHPQQAQSKGCAREQVRCQGKTNECAGARAFGRVLGRTHINDAGVGARGCGRVLVVVQRRVEHSGCRRCQRQVGMCRPRLRMRVKQWKQFFFGGVFQAKVQDKPKLCE